MIMKIVSTGAGGPSGVVIVEGSLKSPSLGKSSSRQVWLEGTVAILGT